MHRRLTAVIGTAAVALCALLGSAAPAHAASACRVSDFSPHSVTVGLSARKVGFALRTSGCVAGNWTLESDSFFVYDEAPSEVFWASENLINDEAGAHDAVATAFDAEDDEVKTVFPKGWSLRKATYWSAVDASPEPVKKGSLLRITGTLHVADWDADRYVGYKGRLVAVQFRTPTGTYTNAKLVTTGSGGKVSTTVTARATGVWRLSYGGRSTAAGSNSTGDAVTVK